MNNIKKIRKSQNISVTELAEKLAMSQGNLTKIENAQIPLKADLAAKIAAVLNVPVSSLTDFAAKDGLRNVPLINPETLALPPYAELALPTALCPEAKELRLFAAFDDAMAPMVKKNALVFISLAETFTDDGIYLLNISSRLVLRRLQQSLNGKIWVLCENKIYQPESISAEQLKIVGKLAGVITTTIF